MLLDMSVAFDTIYQSTLLPCLSSWFGVGGVTVQWFVSNIAIGYKGIKVDTTFTDMCKLLHGVP